MDKEYTLMGKYDGSMTEVRLLDSTFQTLKSARTMAEKFAVAKLEDLTHISIYSKTGIFETSELEETIRVEVTI